MNTDASRFATLMSLLLPAALSLSSKPRTPTCGSFSPDEAATVFEKFSRGNRSNLEPGAGLGLSISRALMRRMGGDLTLEFADDQTSFFRVRLAGAEGTL